MSWLFTNVISAILLPPLNLLMIMLLSLVIWHRHPRISRMLFIFIFLIFWFLSTPIVAEYFLHSLEEPTQSLHISDNPADAIVVLGAGTYFNAPEYSGDTVSSASLERLRYAVTLYRLTGKPILLSGGTPEGNQTSEAKLMKQVLVHEFNVPVQFTEEDSKNTLESALKSFTLLRNASISRIYLVSHAWHMPRSVEAFRSAGFEVIPAPTSFTTHYSNNLLNYLPNATAFKQSQLFLHESIGILWYKLKS